MTDRKTIINGDNALIPHDYMSNEIAQRKEDGYLSATAMCKSAGKQIGHYKSTSETKAFLKALSFDIGIPITELIQAKRGGNSSTQGTWVHPRVAMHLAQWLSPEFAVQVSSWVLDWVSGGNGNQPPHSNQTPLLTDGKKQYYLQVIEHGKPPKVTPIAETSMVVDKQLIDTMTDVSHQMFSLLRDMQVAYDQRDSVYCDQSSSFEEVSKNFQEICDRHTARQH